MGVAERGGRVISAIDEGTWQDTPQSRFQRRILDAAAAYEKEIGVERTLGTMKEKRASGELYSHVPYGFKLGEPVERKDGKDVRLVQTIVTDESEARTIRFITQWREENVSLGGIAKRLDSMGIPTKSGKLWSRGTIQTLLNRIQGKPKARRGAGEKFRPVRQFLEGVSKHAKQEKKTG